MFDSMFDETVTVRRLDKLDVRGERTYIELRDHDGKPWPLRLRIERRASRTLTREGVEILADATAFFRADLAPPVRTEDLLVTSRGEAFKVVQLEVSRLPFSHVDYARAALQSSRQPVPADAGE